MPSFDIVCEANWVEINNATANAAKEIATRFDFKGTCAAIEIKDKVITIVAESQFQLGQIEDILRNKLTKRGVDIRFLELTPPQKISGDKLKEEIKIKNGIETTLAKQIQKSIKDSKLKVQASIQGESVRVSGNKRDDLQAVMALVKKIDTAPLSFNNLRD